MLSHKLVWLKFSVLRRYLLSLELFCVSLDLWLLVKLQQRFLVLLGALSTCVLIWPALTVCVGISQYCAAELSAPVGIGSFLLLHLPTRKSASWKWTKLSTQVQSYAKLCASSCHGGATASLKIRKKSTVRYDYERRPSWAEMITHDDQGLSWGCPTPPVLGVLLLLSVWGN